MNPIKRNCIYFFLCLCKTKDSFFFSSVHITFPENKHNVEKIKKQMKNKIEKMVKALTYQEKRRNGSNIPRVQLSLIVHSVSC